MPRTVRRPLALFFSFLMLSATSCVNLASAPRPTFLFVMSGILMPFSIWVLYSHTMRWIVRLETTNCAHSSGREPV